MECWRINRKQFIVIVPCIACWPFLLPRFLACAFHFFSSYQFDRSVILAKPFLQGNHCHCTQMHCLLTFSTALFDLACLTPLQAEPAPRRRSPPDCSPKRHSSPVSLWPPSPPCASSAWSWPRALRPPAQVSERECVSGVSEREKKNQIRE